MGHYLERIYKLVIYIFFTPSIHKKYASPVINDNLSAMNDNGQIENLHVGNDGKPYITYKVGADTVTKKLGSGTIKKFVASQLQYTYRGSYPISFNLSSVYADYKNITANDIAGGIHLVSAGSTSTVERTGSASFGEITGYNPDTGVINATVNIGTGNNGTVVNVTPCFYIIG